jgi:hypothetical protein
MVADEREVTMDPHAARTMDTLDWILPVVIAAIFVALMSLLREPTRRRFNAIFVAGAASAYMNYGGFGAWEFPFTALGTWLAFRGLDDYRFIAVAWLCHTVWDVAHHLWGNPIMPIQATSSAGCAITDALIAVWFWWGAPSMWTLARGGDAPATATALRDA